MRSRWNFGRVPPSIPKPDSVALWSNSAERCRDFSFLDSRSGTGILAWSRAETNTPYFFRQILSVASMSCIV